MSGEDRQDRERSRHLLMAELDGELTPQERGELERALAADAELRAERARLHELKEVTGAMKLKEPPEEIWEGYWVSVYNRAERGRPDPAVLGRAGEAVHAPARSVQGDPAMIVTPGSSIAGHRIVKTLGLVRGNTIRARHLGKDILAGLKNLVGGEIEEYTKMLAEAREQALDRMLTEAKGLGANAIVDVRFSTSYIMGMASEIMAYGNAVVIEMD